MKITLNEVKDVYELVKVAQSCLGDVIVRQNANAVNAMSILGLFSLDLTQPIEISVEDMHFPDNLKIGDFLARLKK